MVEFFLPFFPAHTPSHPTPPPRLFAFSLSFVLNVDRLRASLHGFFVLWFPKVDHAKLHSNFNHKQPQSIVMKTNNTSDNLFSCQKVNVMQLRVNLVSSFGKTVKKIISSTISPFSPQTSSSTPEPTKRERKRVCVCVRARDLILFLKFYEWYRYLFIVVWYSHKNRMLKKGDGNQNTFVFAN